MMMTLINILTALLLLAGVLGTILPLLPGCPLVFGGVLLYAWYTEFSEVSWEVLLILLVLAVFGEMLEKISSLVGAKKYGASKWGLIGVVVGGILGLIVGGIIGFLIGPFLGAVLFETINGRTLRDSLRAGWGTLIGLLGGVLGKLIIALIMIGVFLSRLVG